MNKKIGLICEGGGTKAAYTCGVLQCFLDNNIELGVKPSSVKEQHVQAFLKGKEAVQPFTTRIPKELYAEFRKIAFEKNIKMNQVVVQLIKDYIKDKKA